MFTSRARPGRAPARVYSASGAGHDLVYEEWECVFEARAALGASARARADARRGLAHERVRRAGPEGLTPHVPQKIVMARILAALSKRQNAVVESPTGTGKSLALLCSALAWREERQKEADAANENIHRRNALGGSGSRAGWRCRARSRRAREPEAKPKASGSPPKTAAAPRRSPPRGRSSASSTSRRSEKRASVHARRPPSARLRMRTTRRRAPPTPTSGAPTLSCPEIRSTAATTFAAADAANAAAHAAAHAAAGIGDTLAPLSVHKLEEEAEDAEEADAGGRAKREVSASGPPIIAASSTCTTSRRPREGPRGAGALARTVRRDELAKELKRTPYRPKYTILGSRRQYCPINKSDEESAPRDGGVGGGRGRWPTTRRTSYARSWTTPASGTWRTSRRRRARTRGASTSSCATFTRPRSWCCARTTTSSGGTSTRANQARRRRIIDEGHSVEDVCREGASTDVTLREMETARAELAEVQKYFPGAASAARLMTAQRSRRPSARTRCCRRARGIFAPRRSIRRTARRP